MANRNVPEKLPLEAQELTLSESSKARGQMALMVSQCFDALRQYGKEPEQVEGVVRLFSLVLAPYSMKQISQAFSVYLSRYSEMPTPADIAQIIRRGGKPPFEKSVYVALCQKRERTSFVDAGYHGNGLSTEEEDYIKEYERDALGKDG